MACIHLAAALQRAERDLRTYAAARVLVNPGSLVLRQTFRAAAGLDAQATSLHRHGSSGEPSGSPSNDSQQTRQMRARFMPWRGSTSCSGNRTMR
jgi:hypothetical protein